jgi:hypothetical protein
MKKLGLAFLAMLLCVPVSPNRAGGRGSLAGGQEANKVNPELAKIRRLFIKGNSEAATFARKSGPNQRYGDRCFKLVGNEKAADGTLELSQEVVRDGAAATVSGTIMDKDGNLIWSDSEHGEGVLFTPAGDAAVSLMGRVIREACGPVPPIQLGKVRRIYLIDPDHLDAADREQWGRYFEASPRKELRQQTKAVQQTAAWKSDCLTFVRSTADADAILLPDNSGPALRWALLDWQSNSFIPGWSTDSFPDVKKLEEAVGCH